MRKGKCTRSAHDGVETYTIPGHGTAHQEALTHGDIFSAPQRQVARPGSPRRVLPGGDLRLQTRGPGLGHRARSAGDAPGRGRLRAPAQDGDPQGPDREVPGDGGEALHLPKRDDQQLAPCGPAARSGIKRRASACRPFGKHPGDTAITINQAWPCGPNRFRDLRDLPSQVPSRSCRWPSLPFPAGSARCHAPCQEESATVRGAVRAISRPFPRP